MLIAHLLFVFVLFFFPLLAGTCWQLDLGAAWTYLDGVCGMAIGIISLWLSPCAMHFYSPRAFATEVRIASNVTLVELWVVKSTLFSHSSARSLPL